MSVEKLHTLARRLHELREAAGLTQYGLAQRSGVPRQTIHRVEHGERMPGWEVACKLARALGQPPTAFAAEVVILEARLFGGLIDHPMMRGYYIDPQWCSWATGHESLAYIGMGMPGDGRPRERRVVFPGLSEGTFLIFAIGGYWSQKEAKCAVLIEASAGSVFEWRSSHQALFQGKEAELVAVSETGLEPLYDVLRQKGFQGKSPA
jgi:putative transcriptional regulator